MAIKQNEIKIQKQEEKRGEEAQDESDYNCFLIILNRLRKYVDILTFTKSVVNGYYLEKIQKTHLYVSQTIRLNCGKNSLANEVCNKNFK
jgi:hypothetical protein